MQPTCGGQSCSRWVSPPSPQLQAAEYWSHCTLARTCMRPPLSRISQSAVHENAGSAIDWQRRMTYWACRVELSREDVALFNRPVVSCSDAEQADTNCRVACHRVRPVNGILRAVLCFSSSPNSRLLGQFLVLDFFSQSMKSHVNSANGNTWRAEPGS